MFAIATWLLWLVAATAAPANSVNGPPPNALEIYFIDVEGGQSTLVVTPAGESLLIDAGFPSTGTFQSRAGDPANARDTQRIVVAAHAAGLTRIDYLVVTHFHADHAGGVAELAQVMPIGTFIDHGDLAPEAERAVPGTQLVFEEYTGARAKGRHLVPRVGDRLPVRGLEATVVSTGGLTLTKALPGAGQRNAVCADSARPPQEAQENPRSIGIRVQFGKFTFLDLGDLTGEPLFKLVCPRDLIGPVDVYVVPHHGGPDAADPAMLAAFRPRVAIVNNGATKGGAPEVFASLRQAPGPIDVWQLHRSDIPGAENFQADRLANLDDRTAYWITLSANDDGSFRLQNARTGAERRYSAR